MGQLGTTRIWVPRGALWRLGSSIATAACSFHGGSMEGLDGFGMGNGKVGGIKTYNCVLLGIFLLAKLCILYMYMYIFF